MTNGLVVAATAARKAVDRRDDQIVKGINADSSLKKAEVAVCAERGSPP